VRRKISRSFTLATKRFKPSASVLSRVFAGMTIFLPLFQTLRPTRRALENAADTVP
jgi:hypothetical protein